MTEEQIAYLNELLTREMAIANRASIDARREGAEVKEAIKRKRLLIMSIMEDLG